MLRLLMPPRQSKPFIALFADSPSERSGPAADATREVRERWLLSALLISQPLFWYQFSAFITFLTPAAFRRALPHNLGASRHRTFPQLNLHKARVRRNLGRLPSDGFI